MDEIDLAQIIDIRPFDRFNLTILAWSFLVCFVDGYDFTLPGYIAPYLVQAWHVPGSALAPVFSAAIVGILLGAPLLGYMGDRYGRKTALVAGMIAFGFLTLASMASTSVTQMVVLRFFAGMALGGVMGIAIVLNSEFAPMRLRATLICIMFSGLTVGAGVPGVVVTWLAPAHGWQIAFLIGGIAPLVLALGILRYVPESLKFLALRDDRRDRLVRLVKQIQPRLDVTAASRFVIADEANRRSDSIKALFAQDLLFVTPMLWLMCLMVGITVYFVQIWTPLLLAQGGLSPGEAALSTTAFQVGGMVGVILMGLQFDRWGLAPIVAMLCLGAPAVVLAGTPDLAGWALPTLMFASGYLVLGALNGLNALSAIVYPTSIRGNGVGWAFGVGRIGFLIGAQIGALRGSLTTHELFYVAATPLLVAAAGCVSLGIHRGFAPDPRSWSAAVDTI